MKLPQLLFTFLACLASFAIAKPYTIVIDPGHGGQRVSGVNDGSQQSHGASYNNATAYPASGGKVLEKDIALDYSKALKAELEKHSDVRVILTRSDDRSVSAMMRAAIAVEHQADVLLSIHFNGGSNNTATGARAYIVADDHLKWEYMHFFNPYLKRDKALGLSLVKGLDAAFAPFGGKPSSTKVFNDTKYPRSANGLGLGSLKDGIRSIGYARMDTHLHNAAVVLLEIEFLDNKKTLSWLLGPQKEKVKATAAQAMTKTLLSWRTQRKTHQASKPLKAPTR